MTGPAPAVAAVRLAVRRDLADLAEGSVVLVACSGGPDSLALAAAAAFECPRARLAAGAVVIDHGMQHGSAEVALRAAAQCRELGLDPVLVRRVVVETGYGGPEAVARVARYRALEQAAQETGASAVLLGHTMDDQAETVLLGLARGSGARSLAGMPSRRGVLRRPLLGLRRDQTEQACADQYLVPWHDPTNVPDGRRGPLRSVVRHVLLPELEATLGPGVTQALARTAEQLRQDAEVLEALAAELLAAATVPAGEDRGTHAGAGARPDGMAGRTPSSVVLDVATLATAPAAVRRRCLRAAAAAAGAGGLSSAHVHAVDALVCAYTGQGPVDLPGGAAVARRYGRLILAPRTEAVTGRRAAAAEGLDDGS